MFDAWLRGYNRSLKAVLRHKFVTLMVSFAVIGLTFYLYTISKTGFIPDEDQGLVFAFTEAQQGIAFQDMMQLQQKVADVVRYDPSVMNTMSSIGSPINQGRIFFRLKDKKDRVNQMSAMEVIQELRPKVSQIPGPQRVHADSADHPHRRIFDQVAISVHSAIARYRRALPGCAQSSKPLSARFRNCRTSPATCR